MPAPRREVTVAILYQSQPGQAETARDELGALIATVVANEPDCRGIRLLQDSAEPGRLLLIEQWTSEGAFRGPHMTTPHLQVFMHRARDFLAGPPEIRVWHEVGVAWPGGRGD